MKTIREVCQIVGVTRRSLQEYDKIGLLHPTAKTEGGYWLYDDEAVCKLKFIVMFVECGYRRREILDILNDKTRDANEIFDELEAALQEKIKKTESMIIFLDEEKQKLKQDG